jgi:hypothetical protein
MERRSGKRVQVFFFGVFHCFFNFYIMVFADWFRLVFVAVLYTVEFQKRGLPHAHILVWLDRQQQRSDEIIGEASAQLIDGIVSAELPDVLEDPLAYALVDEFMVHGPCGRMNGKCPCMKDGACSKRFPKSFCEETHVDQSGYPIYRRRDDGRTVVKDGHVLDNRWVVPHNVVLLKRYQAHMNVEWCNKTNLVKYLFKYITKGPDRANVVVCPVGGSLTGQQPEAPAKPLLHVSIQTDICDHFWPSDIRRSVGDVLTHKRTNETVNTKDEARKHAWQPAQRSALPI